MTRLVTGNPPAAQVKLRLDINFGDPATPAQRTVALPSLRPDAPPIRILGYPIETVLAEKLVTAIGLGERTRACVTSRTSTS